MRSLIIGIDSGTQSTKALVVNAATGAVVGEAAKSYGLIPNLPPGAKEQHPDTWRQASKHAIRQALNAARVSASEVVALGVSGQQHGFVPLDKHGEVIRPASLCEFSTAEECDLITERLGGAKGALRETGNAILPGYTAPKILWLKRHEPKNFARLATILLPHDYHNFWLTGERIMECGDASGTALLNVKTKKCPRRPSPPLIPAWARPFLRLSAATNPRGFLQNPPRRTRPRPRGVLVSAGGGDNMMGAIGTGNTRSGVVTASFGTSGTIYACTDRPIVDPRGEIGAFCDSTNHWLPLLCTMNVTVATEMVREDFGMTHDQFASEAAKAPPRPTACSCCSYLEGERMPNVPHGTGRLARLQHGAPSSRRPLDPRRDEWV